jgi:parallel beta-helix repeat protein
MRFVPGLILLLILAGVLASFPRIRTALASGTIYIRADGSVDPSTVPILSKDNVTYTFTNNITDSIVIERDNIVVDGAGYTVQGAANTGISADDLTNVTIKNTNIKNFAYGISLESSSGSTIVGNNITNNTWGISLGFSSSISIFNNDIGDNGGGIWLGYSSNNSISGNNITNNNEGIYLSVSDDSNMISGNNITNSVYYSVSLESSSNNTISGNNMMNNSVGIELRSSFNNVLSGNNLTANNLYGIYLDSSSNNSISGNNIANSYYGFLLESSSNNSISGNNIADNEDGLYTHSSSNNMIFGNNIAADSSDGISLESSSNNSIFGNNMTNSYDGIYIHSSSYNNSISENNIKDDDYGINVYISSGNTIHHNKFVNNTRQVYSDGSPNVWDNGYPSGGNYWSDYVGNDTYSGSYQNETGRDGIGDSPYIIDENNRDRYPLIPEHELAVSITTPIYLQHGSSSSLDAIITNDGFNDEANVNLTLLINGTTADSTTIPLLGAGDSYTLSYRWTPTVQGTYNVTAYAHPVPNETSVENNQKTAIVTVVVSMPFGTQVGVKAGDWIKCTYTISGWPAGTPYPKWLKVEFLSVEGANATVRVTMHMSDGTEQNATVPVNVATGGQALGLSGFIIPANATTGDSVYISGYGNVTIDGETTRSYAGASRTVVYASFSQYWTQLTYYWDKQTGVIVEASTTSGSMTGTGKATETNIWKAQPTGLPIDSRVLYALIIAVVVILAALVLVKRRRKKSAGGREPATLKTKKPKLEGCSRVKLSFCFSYTIIIIRIFQKIVDLWNQMRIQQKS